MARSTVGNYKLFVYGSLANRDYFQIITGKDLPRRPATLPGFERVVSQRAFPYIVSKADASVPGVLIEGLDKEILAHLDRYEDNGRLYNRQSVLVIAGSEEVIAYAYVGNPWRIAEHFGLDLEQADRVAQHLDQEIDEVIYRTFRPAEVSSPELELRARRELMADTISELRHSHFQNPSWPSYMTRYNLERAALPSLAWLREDTEAQRYANCYLRLIARITVFNQIEKMVRTDFRAAVRVSDPYYHHTISSLIAFTFVNDRSKPLSDAIRQAGLDVYTPEREYLDYAREAIVVADTLYDRQAADQCVEQVNANRQTGGTPLGAELEFAHLGSKAVGAPAGADPYFDSFYYFHDFDLARRLWKVGGYVDDHTGVVFDESRSRGFLELAFGRLRVGGDLSRPATHDVWILSEISRQAAAFMPVRPHSMHLSQQADSTRPFTRLDDPQFLFCLLLLGGDLSPDETGILREKRIHRRETVNEYTGLDFSRLNSHRASEDAAHPTAVVEFTFPRLTYQNSYEPLILALKGFQWARNPWPLDFSEKCPHRAFHREVERELFRWARRPQPVSAAVVDAFLAEVEQGLQLEHTTTGGHSPEYLASGLARIETLLKNRNQLIREFRTHAANLRKTPQANP